MNCWICGENADTGEHLIKASDLRSMFGHVTQNNPIYVHTNLKRNQRVPGIRSDKLKYKSRICARCNNERTQPHDHAWEKLSGYLRNRKPPIQDGTLIRLARVFPGAVQRSMLGVHLFFLKQFGCLIAEHSIPLDISAFSQAILNQSPHPKVHLKFLTGFEDPSHKLVSRSAIQTAALNGSIAYATWIYIVDSIAVNVIYAEPMERRSALIHSWHPTTVGKRVRILNYDA